MQPVTREGPLEAELERALSEHHVRVLLVQGARGVGRTTLLRSFAERIRSQVPSVAFVEAEPLGGFPGACVDAWVRALLSLPADVTGEAVEPVVDSALGAAAAGDPLGREFFCMMLGHTHGTFRTASLAPSARWDGATASLSHWLRTRNEPWMVIVDDAPAADQESLGLIEVLAGTELEGAGLVVLSVRDDSLVPFERRLRPFRSAGRFSTITLRPPPAAEFQPGAARAHAALEIRNPLAATLVGASGLTPTHSSIDHLLLETLSRLGPLEQRLLALLAVAGGRLPGQVLRRVLSHAALDATRALSRVCLVDRAPTRRFPGDEEVSLRFPKLLHEAERRAGRAEIEGWASHLVEWALQALEETGSDWAGRAPLLGSVLARGAEVRGEPARCSMAWELTARWAGEAAPPLRRAVSGAQGTRARVLARRLADLERLSGDAKAPGPPPGALSDGGERPPLEPGWEGWLFSPGCDALDRWDQLTDDEARLAAEVAQAQTFAVLGQSADARRLFEGVEGELLVLSSRACPALWLRWGSAWASFNAEALGSGAGARRVCEVVRKHVSSAAMLTSAAAPDFLEVERSAHARGGDPAKARACADELVAVTRAQANPAAECAALQSRALLHVRDGELADARAGLDRALERARDIGLRRREASVLHELGLTCCQLGDYDAAATAHEAYGLLAERIGDQRARAAGPAGTAAALLGRGDLAGAEPLVAKARRVAEERQWFGLVAWARFLAAELKLRRCLERRDTLVLSLARNDLLACLDLLEERSASWESWLDPAQGYALLALSWKLSVKPAEAQRAVERASQAAKGSPASRAWTDAARELLAGRRPVDALGWFEAHGYRRTQEFWQRALTRLGLDAPTPPQARVAPS